MARNTVKKSEKSIRIRDRQKAELKRRFQQAKEAAHRKHFRWKKEDRRKAESYCAARAKYARKILKILKEERRRTGRKCINGLGHLHKVAWHQAALVIAAVK